MKKNAWSTNDSPMVYVFKGNIRFLMDFVANNFETTYLNWNFFLIL